MRKRGITWAIDEHNNACFVVKDRGGQVLAYVYFEDEPGWRSAANLLTLWMGEFVKRFRGIEKQALRKLDMLHTARGLDDLRAPPASRLEAYMSRF